MNPVQICKKVLGDDKLSAILEQLSSSQIKQVLKEGGLKVKLSGGFVSVIGTMLGALLVTTIRSGLLVLQIGSFWLDFFLGIILLLAVLIDRYRGVYAARLAAGRP